MQSKQHEAWLGTGIYGIKENSPRRYVVLNLLNFLNLSNLQSLESFYSALGKLLGEQLAIATQITSESIARTALSWVPGTPLTEEHVLGACTETIDGVVIFLGLCTCRPHHEGSVLLGWEDDLPHMKIEHTPFY